MKKRISSTIPPCSKKKERLVRIKFHMSFIVGGIIEEIQKRVPPLITFFPKFFGGVVATKTQVQTKCLAVS